MEHAKAVPIPQDLDPDQIALLKKLQDGSVTLIKFGRRGTPHKRTFTLTPDMHLLWDSTWKSQLKTQVDLSRVDRVQTGQRTRKFSRFAEKHRGVDANSLSLIYDDQLSSLDLVADNEQQAKTLKGLLERLVAQCHDERTLEDEELKNFRRQWRKADKDGSNTLDRKEVVTLVQKLNITASSRYIKHKLKEVDFNGDGVLQFNEFVHLMRALGERPEVEALYLTLLQVSEDRDPSRSLARFLREDRASYPPTEPEKLRLRQEFLPLGTFALFVREVQGETVSDEGVKDLAATFGPLSASGGLSYRCFFNYIGSVQHNSAMRDEMENTVYQDMTQPLSHYYIASSHNTYLEGDQLQSNSSVNRYINDLCKGCRCVELDCWDGDDGEPLIYHGYTLTGRIRFSDVIQAVKDYAFTRTDYPVILSLENHCSMPQQEKMAECMVRVLGDSRAVLPDLGEGEPLPSPESLRGKIVIKGKVVSEGEEYAELDEEEDEDEEIQEKVTQSRLGKAGVYDLRPAAHSSVATGATTAATAVDGKPPRDKLPPMGKTAAKAADVPPPAPLAATPGVSGASGDSMGSTGSAPEARRRSSRSNSKEEKKKKKIHPKLSAITFLAGVKFKGFEAAKLGGVNNISAFNETKTDKLIKKSPQEWMLYNRRNTSRIYPGGSRVDSSNYDPVPSWNVGSQIVALNYQTPGTSMQLNDGKYRDNGGCGYLLKPLCLRSGPLFNLETGPFPPGEMTLTIQIVSGRQLPKPGGAQQGEIIDPYVVVSTHGVSVDCKKAKSTKVVQDNGFNPVWNETCSFRLSMPETALVMFTVMDKDVNADDFVAQAVLPVKTLRQGYRSIRLYSSSGTMHGDFEHASLLCRFTLAPTEACEQAKKNGAV